MAVARPPTRPVRVSASDHASLRALSSLEGRVPADIVHDALREYIGRRGADLSARFDAAQRALSSGDIEAVVGVLGEGRESRVGALREKLDQLR